MKRCDWKVHMSDERAAFDIPRIKISNETIRKLRSIAGSNLPVLRPSLQKILLPQKIEEAILSAVMKHLPLVELLEGAILEDKQSSEYSTLHEVIFETYKKMNGLIRILQHIAELETQWQDECEDLRCQRRNIKDCFFANYGFDESKQKDIILLSFLQDVDYDCHHAQKAVQELQDKLEIQAHRAEMETSHIPKTEHLLESLFQRLDLLLNAHIVDTSTSCDMMTRSLQTWPPESVFQQPMNLMDDSVLQIPKLKQKRAVITKSITEPHLQLLNQLFEFVGSNPVESVNTRDFLKALRSRESRGRKRSQAFKLMKDILDMSESNGSESYIMTILSNILEEGPKLHELTCGGYENEVKQQFSELLQLLVSKASEKFENTKEDILTPVVKLCSIPYTSSEEDALAKSGLLHLLDKMCSDQDPGDKEVRLLSWAAFKVLTSRCMNWHDNKDHQDSFLSLRLPQQISVFLTNNLNRARTACNETSNYEGLQEILSILLSLSQCSLGKNILSQPTCISLLLALMLEQKLSPKMIQTIIQLCHVALPMLSQDSFDYVHPPSWKFGQRRIDVTGDESSLKIVKLLLAKIADFLVPGYQVTPDQEEKSVAPKDMDTIEQEPLDEEIQVLPDMERRMCLYLYRGEEDIAHDLIQKLLTISTDMRLFRMNDAQSMEKIVRIDNDLTKHKKAEICTDDANVILRRAIKLAQAGFVVSVSPTTATTRSDDLSQEKKNAVEQVAKDRNIHLNDHDPVRPYLSAAVADSLAADLIALLHTLLISKNTEVWMTAIHQMASTSLKSLRKISESKDLLTQSNNDGDEMLADFYEARELLAVLATIGGHSESLKSGLTVQITGDYCVSEGEILALSNSTGLASVQLHVPDDVSHFPRPDNILHVPITRLRVKKKLSPVSLFMPIGQVIVDNLQSMLLPDTSGCDPLTTPLPSQGDAKTLKLATGRLVAQVRCYSTQVLAMYLEDPEFACRFLQSSCQAGNEIWLSFDFNKFSPSGCSQMSKQGLFSLRQILNYQNENFKVKKSLQRLCQTSSSSIKKAHFYTEENALGSMQILSSNQVTYAVTQYAWRNILC